VALHVHLLADSNLYDLLCLLLSLSLLLHDDDDVEESYENESDVACDGVGNDPHTGLRADI